MIDVDDKLRSELDRLVPRDSRRDWDEIAAAAGLRRERAQLRWALASAAALAAAAVVAVSTPLGGALARSFDDFSAWLSGDPGTPASEADQREFEEANARSWLRFPQGTRLRHLLTTEAGGTTVKLFGFRSGSSELCLRLTIAGEPPASATDCAPLAELRRAGGPARAVLVDHPVGKGDKFAWFGIWRYHSSQLQLTAGIAADAVQSVVVEDDSGRHEVPASSNAFLYVAEEPDVGQRVKRIWARTERGLAPVPFVPAPGVGGGGVPPRSVAAPPAPRVQRRVTGGRIEWLEAREPRGEPLDVLPEDLRSSVLGQRPLGRRPRPHVLFGRVLTPDPDRPLRVVATLTARRANGLPAGLCTWLATRSGTSGGCSVYPDVFERQQVTTTLAGHGSAAFMTLVGLASDEVARSEVLLADGDAVDVPLADNAFAVDLPRASLPARLVAYDGDDRVIYVSRAWHDFGDRAGPARGRARSLLRVAGTGGASAELLVGPSTDGGECVFLKHFVDKQHTGVMVGCHQGPWTGPALQLGTNARSIPARLVTGRVRSDVKSVRIRFADGSATTVTPVRGYVLWAAPKERLDQGRGAVEAVGLGEDGTVVARQSLIPRRR
jgi:hypothetical protein